MTIYREVGIARDADAVWDAVRDIGHAHLRLFPGVLTNVELVPAGRIVTFANGAVVREPTVDIDGERRRYAWTTEGGNTSHFNASLRVVADGTGACRIEWTTDFLPSDLRTGIEPLVDAGVAALRAAFEN